MHGKDEEEESKTMEVERTHLIKPKDNLDIHFLSADTQESKNQWVRKH